MKSLLASPKLRRELRSAGAKETELDGLMAVAAGLGRLKTAPLPRAQQSRSRWAFFAPIGATAFASLLIGALLVAFSQTSIPNSLLYPIKRASEHVAIAVNPDYRGVVMMRRAQEVQKLVADRAGTKTVLATLADYRSEAVAYKSTATNYSVFEFCKTNLQQAEAGASGPERQAIQGTLASLNDV